MPGPDTPERQSLPDEPDEMDRFLFSVLSNSSPAYGSATPSTSLHELGSTPLARQLGLTDEQTNGHWCSRCEGIWYGYTLEVECPVCGNRKG